MNKPVSSILLFPWANFDGVHYLNIAGNGYTTNARFFPLFPLFAGFISRMMGAQKAFDQIYFLSSLILSNLFFVISLWVLYALVRKDYSKSIAWWTSIFLLLFYLFLFREHLFGKSFSTAIFTLFLFCEKKAMGSIESLRIMPRVNKVCGHMHCSRIDIRIHNTREKKPIKKRLHFFVAGFSFRRIPMV